MSVQRITGRYAKSLIDLALEQNKLERILEDVQSFKKVSENRDFLMMIKSPIVQASKKMSVVKALFDGKYDKLTMSFLRILIQKGREPYLPEIADEFIAQYKSIKHITSVKVTTATPMSATAITALQRQLEASPQTDTSVEIETAVDAELIGGFVLEFDGNIYDSSIAHKLDALKREFKA